MANRLMPRKTSETADNLIRVTERLSSLMCHEVELLRGRRARDIRALQGDKESLSAVYQRLMQDLQSDPDLLEGLDDGRRTSLIRAARNLEEAASDNAIALHSALQANRQLMAAIAEAVKQHSTENAPYARNGRIVGTSLPGRRTPASTPSLALNQTL
jgi:uncharacterized protein (DUF885 family)